MIFDVMQYGAVGDGVTDDTAAIQNAINGAIAAGGGIVYFPPGMTYRVSMLNIQHGLTIDGYGATIKRLPNQTKWTRTFTTYHGTYQGYKGPVDSAPLIIRGLTLDGNRANQGSYTSYELEQAHLVFLSGHPAEKGKLRVIIEDCLFKECVADAVSVWKNTSVKISNCTAENCFRGSVVVTGGYSDVQVTNLKAYGDVHPTGIDIEIDSAGYGSSMRTEITMDNIYLAGDFDVAIKEGSMFLGSKMICKSPPFNLYAVDSMVKISDSVFHVGVKTGTANRLFAPYDVTFENCTFYADDASSDPSGTWVAGDHEIACINVYPYGKTNQTLKLLNCDFKAAASVEATDTLYAVYLEADLLQSNNRIILDGCSVSNAFDYGVYVKQGGNIAVKNSRLEANTSFNLGLSGSGYDFNVVLDGVEAVNPATLLQIVSSSPTSKLTASNVMIDESINLLKTTYGLKNNVYAGGRTILGNSTPIGRSVPGLLNDVFRLKTPVPGQPFEWICTDSHQLAAAWKVKTTIGV